MINQGSFLWSEIVISGQEMYLSRESVLLKTMDVMKRFVFSIGGGGGAGEGGGALTQKYGEVFTLRREGHSIKRLSLITNKLGAHNY